MASLREPVRGDNLYLLGAGIVMAAYGAAIQEKAQALVAWGAELLSVD